MQLISKHVSCLTTILQTPYLIQGVSGSRLASRGRCKRAGANKNTYTAPAGYKIYCQTAKGQDENIEVASALLTGAEILAPPLHETPPTFPQGVYTSPGAPRRHFETANAVLRDSSL
ncbi:hypothetical protein E2C01_059702 [Portunus trituberculatus]|uniref:Uncharacterized protein n=1 Tax=Portunus trituberculatus TaxID=210409 RepID=A0A5B7H9S6_PORTR|nr:hypothetical protein [Portunus trituberculatus]